MAKEKKEEKVVYRVEVRLNPSHNPQDAAIVARLERSAVTPGHFVKMLMVNYFCLQPGGFGLLEEEQVSFARLQPKLANKKRKDLFPDEMPIPSSPKRTESKKTKVSDGPTTGSGVTEAKVGMTAADIAKDKNTNAVEAAPVLGGSSASDAGSRRIPWGPDNPPPCLDMSDFENFGK